jgi:hypothetical protein
MLRLIASEQRHHADRPTRELFIFQDGFNLVCDCLCLRSRSGRGDP